MSFNILNNVYQHYDVLSERIPKSKHNEYFSKRLRAILSYPQYYIYNSEVDINNYSSIYYFEHIKEELIKLISTQVHADDREILLHENRNHILFKDTLYDILIKHNLKDLVIPCFIWLSYFNDTNLNLIKENMEYLKNKCFSFQSIDELYNLGRGNTFFRLPYISENNKEFLQYVCKFMRSICSDLTYKRKYIFDNVKQENKIQDIKIKHKEKLKKRVGFISERLKTDSSVLRDRFKIIDRGYIREGYWADCVLVDLEHKHTVTKENTSYFCGWSPFEGDTFNSKIISTFVNGRHAYNEGKILETNLGMQLEFDR